MQPWLGYNKQVLMLHQYCHGRDHPLQSSLYLFLEILEASRDAASERQLFVTYMQREKTHSYFDLLASDGKLLATCPVDAFQAYTSIYSRSIKLWTNHYKNLKADTLETFSGQMHTVCHI